MTENNNKLFKEATTATSTEKLNAKVTQSLESSLAKFGASVENVGKTLDNKISQVALPKVDLSLVKLKNNVTNATQGLGKKTTTITPTKILIDKLELGLYFFEIIDKESKVLLYSRGFASVFGEWQTIPEA